MTITHKGKLAPVMWFTPYVRTLTPEPRHKRGTLREWLLLAIAVGALVLSGCSALQARPAPMGEYSCAGCLAAV